MSKALEFSFRGVGFKHLEHDTVVLTKEKSMLVFDPYKVEPYKDELEQDAHLQYVFLSHDHFDHFSPQDIDYLLKNMQPHKDFKIVFPKSIYEKVHAGLVDYGVTKDKLYPVSLFESYDLPFANATLRFVPVPAYNINKFKEPGKVYHPREAGYAGYVLKIGSVRVYFAGDTDLIPELSELKGHVDIAFVPISGTYVMTLEEAVEAVGRFLPLIVIPMHYGSIVGDMLMGQRFAKMVEDRYNGKIKVFYKL